MINSKHILSFCFLISQLTLLARAGGGGTSGGGGGGGLHSFHSHGGNGDSSSFFVLFLVIIAILLFVVGGQYMASQKNKKNLQLLKLASEYDVTWNLEYIKKHTFDVFVELQKVWEEKKLKKVKSLITSKCFDDLSKKLNDLNERQLINIMENIEINRIDIISVKDFKENSKDSYIAFIEGRMIDYSIDEITKRELINPNKDVKDFKDSYEFIRVGNKWMLDAIVNNPTLSYVINNNSYKEE